YRRRAIQQAYNEKHGITPETTRRSIKDFSPASGEMDYYSIPKGTSAAKPKKGKQSQPPAIEKRAPVVGLLQEPAAFSMPPEELAEQIEALRSQMFTAAENLEFETAARLRDQLNKLQSGDMSSLEAPAPVLEDKKPSRRKPSSSAKKKSGPARKPGVSDVPDSSAEGA